MTKTLFGVPAQLPLPAPPPPPRLPVPERGALRSPSPVPKKLDGVESGDPSQDPSTAVTPAADAITPAVSPRPSATRQAGTAPASAVASPLAKTTTPAANQPRALALGKTLAATKSAAEIPTPAKAALPAEPRLPTEAEARDRPELVISLDDEPPIPAPTATKQSTPQVPDALADALSDLPAPPPRFPSPPLNEAPAQAVETAKDVPTDLPPVGSGKPFRLPQPGEPNAGSGPQAAADAKAAGTLATDAMSAFTLLRWALGTYLARPLPWLALAAMVLLPVAFGQAFVLAAVARGSDPATLVLPGVATVDLSESKAALARRIQASQAKGSIDAQAAAALAALTAVEGAEAALAPRKSSSDGVWREYLARFIAGLLLFGFAVPLASAALTIAAADRQGGAALPGMADVGPILLARRELFLLALLPAALLVALGHAVFVVPGLVLAVLFLFVPHAVVFEKRRGRAALERSIELVRADPVRVVVTFVALSLAGFVIAVLAGLVLPTSGSRATVFLNSTVSSLLLLAVLPVPVLAMARIYFDIRARAGATPERLSRAARG